ncbi:hypothetical protein BH11PLA1_BH11PLA1_20640 [soil metagenome]
MRRAAPAPRAQRRGALALAALAGLVVASTRAGAQEAMYTAAATMPSPGVTVVRQQFMFAQYGASPSEGFDRVQRLELRNTIQYGLIKNLSIAVETPIEFSHIVPRGGAPTRDEFGAEDVDLMAKWRVFQNDSGGIDTQRIAILGGTRLRTDGRFSADPHLGAVYTQVIGRHGFNIHAEYWLNTGRDKGIPNFGGRGAADAAALNLAYVFRFFPAEFDSDSTGAWYLTAELNNLYETNGDFETRFSPGLMYEGRRFGFELMAQLPVYTHLDSRARQNFAIGIGWRLIF